MTVLFGAGEIVIWHVQNAELPNDGVVKDSLPSRQAHETEYLAQTPRRLLQALAVVALLFMDTLGNGATCFDR